ncbi:MAG: hypothetical protein WBH85_18920 [Thermoanaerobaculia bacterium]
MIRQDSGVKLAWVAAGIVLVVLLACQQRFEYDLDTEDDPQDGARTESTDGSWAAALGEILLPLVEDHDTEYAEGFSDDVFRSLEMGLSRADLLRLLGSPLSVKEFPDGSTCLYYSRHGGSSANYFVRVLVLDEKSSLVARRRYFYVD